MTFALHQFAAYPPLLQERTELRRRGEVAGSADRSAEMNRHREGPTTESTQADATELNRALAWRAGAIRASRNATLLARNTNVYCVLRDLLGKFDRTEASVVKAGLLAYYRERTASVRLVGPDTNFIVQILLDLLSPNLGSEREKAARKAALQIFSEAVVARRCLGLPLLDDDVNFWPKDLPRSVSHPRE